MIEIPPWLLQIIIYAVLTGLFTGIFAPISVKYFFRYLNERKEKKRKEKEELERKLSRTRQSASDLDRTLRERVENNSFERGSGVGWPSNFKERGKNYDEIYGRCVDWKKASKAVITLSLQDLCREHLPKTHREYDLVSLLNTDELTQRYLNGEEVTKRWIEEKYSTGLHEALMENLKDKETKLDHFFLKLNETFQKNEVLKRFREEKKKLMELGYGIIKDLREEEEKLRKELEKYKDVGEREKGLPKM